MANRLVLEVLTNSGVYADGMFRRTVFRVSFLLLTCNGVNRRCTHCWFDTLANNWHVADATVRCHPLKLVRIANVRQLSIGTSAP